MDEAKCKMYKIYMEILARSHFRLPILKSRKEHLFVTGEKYDLKARIKNIGTTTFPGGNFSLDILWSNGLLVFWRFPVRRLQPGESVKVNYGITDVLADGPALFYAKAIDFNGQSIDFYDMKGNPIRTQPVGNYQGWIHIYSIIPKNAEALYELWALEVAAISLVILIIFQIIDWCIRYYSCI